MPTTAVDAPVSLTNINDLINKELEFSYNNNEIALNKDFTKNNLNLNYKNVYIKKNYEEAANFYETDNFLDMNTS